MPAVFIFPGRRKGTMKEFYIDDDGIKLHAKLDMPAGREEGSKCPLVIIIHGLTGHMEERHIVAIAEQFNDMGMATLRAEMYGHGKSGGDFHEHNLFKWLNNAMTVTDYAKSLDFVTDLYLCGHSQGGITTILLGAMKSSDFKAIMPLSPATFMTECARSGRQFGLEFDPDDIPDEIYVNPEQTVSSNYFRAAQLLDIDYAIRKYKGPVLIVHGDQDEAIPVHYSVEAASKYSNARLVVIKGDDHCYNYHLDEVLAAIREFTEEVRG